MFGPILSGLRATSSAARKYLLLEEDVWVNETQTKERRTRDWEPHENNPSFVVRENEACWFIFSRLA